MNITEKDLLLEIIGAEVDEDEEQDILNYIEEEFIIDENIKLYDYLMKISVEDVLDLFYEYEAKWNPSLNLYDFLLEQLISYSTVYNFPTDIKIMLNNKIGGY